jgi:hypothetical protein
MRIILFFLPFAEHHKLHLAQRVITLAVCTWVHDTLNTPWVRVQRHLKPGAAKSRRACCPRQAVRRAADPVSPCLGNVAALLMLLIRDCKINKPMLIKKGVPAIVSMLKQHKDPRVSVTTVQALSGVLTLLAMSKTMLDVVLQTDGLQLVVELLCYQAHEANIATAPQDTMVLRNPFQLPCLPVSREQVMRCMPINQATSVSSNGIGSTGMQASVASIHEASCVLISCLCDLSSKARSKIVETRGITKRLIELVMSVAESDIVACASPHQSPGKKEVVDRDADVASVAADSQNQALVSALGQLMQNSGPDNYVFQAAMHAMQSVQRHTSVSSPGELPESAGLTDRRPSASAGDELVEEKCAVTPLIVLAYP